jgi:tetratricopeptide (TPR) repeat protein
MARRLRLGPKPGVEPGSRDALLAIGRLPPDGRGRWIRCRNLQDDFRGTGSASNALVRIFPNDPAIRFRGQIHEYVARAGEEHALHAVMTPIEIFHHGYLRSVMADRGKGERNLRVSRTAFEADPADPAHAYNYAASLMLAGDLPGARAMFERACEITETTPRAFRPQALLMLAKLELAAGEVERALATADRCVAIVDSLPDGHFLRGQLLARLRRPTEARHAFKAAIEAGRHASQQFVVDDEVAIWKAANEIASGLMIEQRHAEALPWLDAALVARPAAQPLVINRARCLEAVGDVEGALVAFRAAFEGFRDEPSAIEYVNFVLRHGSPDVCLMAVEGALPCVGTDYASAFLTSTAAMMLRADREAEARGLLERALEIGEPAQAGATVRAMIEHFAAPGLTGLLPTTVPEASR